MHNSSLIRPHFVWFIVVALLALVAARAQENEADDAMLAAKVAKGRSQYLAGESEMAEETFREVARADPGNREAEDFSRRIARDRMTRGELHRERTRTQLLNEVTQSWERPGVLRGRGDDAQTKSPTAPLVEKLNEIVLPNVSFTRAEIAQVVAALSAASEEFDATSVLPKGVNIVLLDPANRAPTVTLTLRNAPLKRVLDFVAESIGYQYEVQADAVVLRPGGETTTLDTEFFPVTRATVLRMTGNTLAISPSAARAEAFSSAGASNEAGPASNAAEGEAMKNFLQQAGVNFEAVAGSSLAYDGSALIVTQTSRNVERIRNILARYNDVRQVEIEAKFMEVQEGALEELGVQWNIATKKTQRNAGAQALYQTSGRTLAGAFSNNSSNQHGSIISPAVPNFIDVNGNNQFDDGEPTQPGREGINLPIINNAPRIPGSAELAAGVEALADITGIIGEFDVNAVVRALSQQQGTDLLSAPKVTVLSGNPATITVAQEMRYPQSFGQTQSQVGTGSASGGGSAGVAITAGTPQEFTARNVGVELKVTPTVEEDDYSISLDLNPKVTEFDGFVEYGGPSIAISGGTTVTVPSGFYQPIFSVRDISTRVTIWDGATLVMGGLTREEVKTVNDKVPILGDLPLIGRAFRSKGESAQKRNLLIFVTANLVSPGGAPKKQGLRGLPASSLFQNPTIVTPAGAELRETVALE
jgi:general secretion pathway protein D